MRIPDTKILPPRLPGQALLRSRLFYRLDEGLKRNLTLLQAGGGWGKTLLLASFFSHRRIPFGWYTLDATDRDALSFLLHTARALAAGFNSLAAQPLKEIQEIGREGARWQTAVAVLFNDILGKMPDHVCMVYDDGQQVRQSTELQTVLAYMLHHAPPNFHIFMATRQDPGLDLARLAMRREMVRIGSADLAFDDEEIRALFHRLGQWRLDSKSVRTLRQYTGGWILSLRMLAGAIPADSEKSPEKWIEALPGRSQPVFDYFDQEVFRPLPEGIRAFLLETSILKRLHADLCDAVRNSEHSAALLDDLLSRGLFITEISSKDRWFRYHPLFRDFLGRRRKATFTRKQIRRLHRRAEAWFRKREDWPSGMFHALAAGDAQRAAEIVEERTDHFIQTASAQTLLYWVDQLPQPMRNNRAGILFARGWALVMKGKWNEAARILHRAKTLAIKEKQPPFIVKTLYFLMVLAYFRMAYAKIPPLAGEARKHLPPDSACLPDLLRMLATALLYMNRTEEAHAVWEELRTSPVVENNNDIRLKTMTLQAPHYYLPLGRFDSALELLAEGLAYYRHHDHMDRYAQYKGFSGHVYHEMGDFEKSQGLFQESAAIMKRSGNPLFLPTLYSALAINAVYLGRLAEARSHLSSAGSVTGHFDTSKLMSGHLLSIGKALLAIRENDREVFFHHAEKALEASEASGNFWDFYIVVGHLSRGYAFFDSRNRAMKLLALALERVRHLGAAFAEARICLLLAAAALDENDKSRAETNLRSSLDIAKARGYDFLFFRREQAAFLRVLPLAVSTGIGFDFVQTLAPRIGPVIAEVITPLLSSNDATTRGRAVALLGLGQCREAQKEMAVLQMDPAPGVREAAGRALARIADLPPLPLRVKLLGPFRIFLEEREIEESAWQRKKALAILKYLVFHHGKKIQTEVLLETFFENLPVDTAQVSLRKAMSTLRTGLEPGLPAKSKSAYLKAGKGAYTFTLPQKSVVDAFRFEDLLAAAAKTEKSGAMGDALAAYQAAAALWNGVFLEDDLYEPWTDGPRERYQERYLQALRKIAEHAFHAVDFNGCLEALDKILQVNRWDEQAYLLQMKCHLARGDRARAVATYRTCKKVLHHDLQIEPSKPISDFYDLLSRN